MDSAHSGSSRRVARSWSVDDGGTLDAVFAQTFDTDASDGYAGLERHGRTADLAFFRDGESEPFHRYQYGYDSSGNRLFARVTQELTDQDRSWVYAYDALGRLVSAERGVMDDTDPIIEFSQSLIPSRVSWGLDRLGNWTEPAGGGEGRVLEEASAQGVYDQLVLARDHATDLRNELTGIDTDDGTGPVSTPHVHDAAGNLVADGVYYYQYDAFNRLAAVYELGDLEFDSQGVPTSAYPPGDWRAKYAYDALGRRVCKQVPWHTGDARMAWYYYDGVRRVQEVFRDPLPPGSLGGNPDPIGNYTVYTDREYVWGPDYVDECLWQVDRTGAAAFVLQDANFNVVALIDETGQVLQQFDYDPYGSVRELDELGAYADNRIGFQGLFADRYDADAPNPEIAVGADQTYYARNRDYSPEIGRWLQPDPLGSGADLVLGPPAGVADTPISAAAVTEVYLHGMSRHLALDSRPLVGTDSLGLFFSTIDLLGGALMESAEQAWDGFINLQGDRATGILLSAIEGYSFNQELDLDWALDWNLSDDLSTRSGVDTWTSGSSGGDEDVGPVWAGGKSKGRFSRLKGVSRVVYNARRRQFESLKPRIWKFEARKHPGRYTDQQLAAMRAGQAPIGSDGQPMAIHHKRALKDGGRNNWDNYAFLEAWVHRKYNKQLHYP